MPDRVSLEITDYTGWDDFRDRILELVDAAADHVSRAGKQPAGRPNARCSQPSTPLTKLLENILSAR